MEAERTRPKGLRWTEREDEAISRTSYGATFGVFCFGALIALVGWWYVGSFVLVAIGGALAVVLPVWLFFFKERRVIFVDGELRILDAAPRKVLLAIPMSDIAKFVVKKQLGERGHPYWFVHVERSNGAQQELNLEFGAVEQEAAAEYVAERLGIMLDEARRREASRRGYR
jgi:hypothetical protein